MCSTDLGNKLLGSEILNFGPCTVWGHTEVSHVVQANTSEYVNKQ